jgi:phospholipase C
VSYIKLIGYKTEHPGAGTKLSAGITSSTALIDEILASQYKDLVLVLLDYDEGGGYFDHVAPPSPSPVDGKPYGTRLPVVAIGPFAKQNWVSHVTMEHSSVVRFIEWNWLGGKTGQLGQRDTVVRGIGSLLDQKATGIAVPE